MVVLQTAHWLNASRTLRMLMTRKNIFLLILKFAVVFEKN
jgi:hypothetical protein